MSKRTLHSRRRRAGTGTRSTTRRKASRSQAGPEVRAAPPFNAMTPSEAAVLGRLFKVLANPNRVRILEALAHGAHRSPGDLARAAGARLSTASNHLGKLVDLGIITARRGGNGHVYRLVDRRLAKLLDHGRRLMLEGKGRG